jgi:hypothetical protein
VDAPAWPLSARLLLGLLKAVEQACLSSIEDRQAGRQAGRLWLELHKAVKQAGLSYYEDSRQAGRQTDTDGRTDRLRLRHCTPQAFLENYKEFPMFHTTVGGSSRIQENLDEFDDARQVVASLSEEYEACEHADYVRHAAHGLAAHPHAPSAAVARGPVGMRLFLLFLTLPGGCPEKAPSMLDLGATARSVYVCRPPACLSIRPSLFVRNLRRVRRAAALCAYLSTHPPALSISPSVCLRADREGPGEQQRPVECGPGCADDRGVIACTALMPDRGVSVVRCTPP